MTKKDYELIARVLKEAKAPAIYPMDKYTIGVLSRRLAIALSSTNSQFNSQKFLEACGIKHNHNFLLVSRVNKKAPYDYEPIDTRQCECGAKKIEA